MGDLFFFAAAFAFLALICLMAFTRRGRGLMFGGKIVKTWDGVAGKRKIVTTQVKVHAVDAAPNLRFVGLELSLSSFASYQMIPITLPLAEAKLLAQMLIEAADYRAGAAET